LDLSRQTQACLDFEAEALAGLAEAQHRAGQLEAAYGSAVQAIEVGRARSNRIAECRALIVRAALCVRSQLEEERRAAVADLAAAKQLINVTGAVACAEAFRDVLKSAPQGLVPFE
jgi:hypothetical protein